MTNNSLENPISEVGPRRRRAGSVTDWYAGESHVQWLEPSEVELDNASNHEGPSHALLGQWASTAISGNDITSSCFYAISFCAANAGIYTPISLLLVVLLLYCFRSVYGEVGTALPLNGGCYTLLLNVSVRGVAAFAACLTLLSYVATAVVSGDSAVNYVLNLLCVSEENWSTYEELATIGVLGFFAILSLVGVSESAIVALVIFGIHMITIVILLITCLIHFIKNPDMLSTNWAAKDTLLNVSHDPVKATLFGFSGALLGVTGFETSANFIEQQKKGVFPLTLRNMWVCVLAINPLMGFLALCTLPIAEVADPSNTALLGKMGRVAGGKWLEVLVSLDAALVLAGAVLTAYVGVIGLIRRLALDRCMPMFFITENKWRRTNHWTILSFFLTCSSLYELLSRVGSDSTSSASGSLESFSYYDLLTSDSSSSGSSSCPEGGGNTNTQNLGKVYTLSFLCVMALFAIGNMILKYKRSRLPRTIRAKWPVAIISFVGVTFGLFLTILLDVSTLQYFFLYYGVTLLIVGVMFLRIRIIKFVIYAIHGIFNPRFGNTQWYHRVQEKLRVTATAINKQAFVFFSSTGDIAHLNKAVLYVRDNEQTQILKIVHVFEDESKIPFDIEENVRILDRCYPKMRIDFVGVKGGFTPEIINYVSKTLGVPKNLMFIACPGKGFPHNIATLGGVRVITTFTAKKGVQIAGGADSTEELFGEQTEESQLLPRDMKPYEDLGDADSDDDEFDDEEPYEAAPAVGLAPHQLPHRSPSGGPRGSIN